MMWMLKRLYGTNDNKAKKLGFMMFAMFLVAFSICFKLSIKDYAFAASGIKIYNYTTKKNYTYTDTQVKVTYNGKKISVDSTPGLIQDGIALVSYKDIFAKSGIKADCVYDKEAGTISISKFGTTIVLKIGSKTAYINGKEVTAPLAPVKIKYVKENVTKILVPSRFVCENLGYSYTWNKSTSTVAIELKYEPMLLSYDDGEPFYYTGAHGKVTVNGKSVNLGNMPSIIVGNTAMLRAKKVFADSEIKAEYSYNSKDKTITLSKNGNTLIMQVGSPVAQLNGKSVVLDTAPMVVTNHNEGESYVMVPGNFTANSLGYDYKWDNSKVTSVITSRKNTTTGKQNSGQDSSKNQNGSSEKPNNTSPELGDKAVTWDTGKILYQIEADKNQTGASSGIYKIEDTASKYQGTIYSVSTDNSKLYLNAEVYAVYGNVPFSNIDSAVSGNQIQINISNYLCVDNTYNFTDYNGSMLATVRSYVINDNTSRLDFTVNMDKFDYDLSLSADKCILYVTIYHNTINKITIGTNDTTDYITLSSNWSLNVSVGSNSNVINADLPGIKKGMEDRYFAVTDSKYLSYAYIYSATDGSHIVLGLKEECDYYIVEDGNLYTLMITAKGTQFTPPATGSQQNTNPTVPVIHDTIDNNYEIMIPNPANLSVSQLEDEDQYGKLRFAIRLPGDYVSYFTQNPIMVNSNAITNISVYLNSNNQTEILVSTSEIQGYAISADDKYIYVNVGKPKEIYKNIVVLDPGHGGSAPGAIYNDTKEKNLTFKILYEIGKDFFDSDPTTLKVYYTRESDVDVSLADRAAFAQKVGADLFVSLHLNANTNKSVYGTEVYYSSSNNTKNQAGLNSETLAKIFVNNISSTLNTKNRGVRAAKYTVVHKNTVPAVLIELAFMSNKDDFNRLSNYTFQYKAAKEIYETLLQVFKQYPTGR